MTKQKQIADQTEFQKGRMDGTRYLVDGHMELLDQYTNGTSDYRIGWDVSIDQVAKRDPSYAS
jgi:hypothetical protein